MPTSNESTTAEASAIKGQGLGARRSRFMRGGC
jgi:hypothetical protein